MVLKSEKVSKKILIFGGSGFIGFNTVKFFLNNTNYQITATYNKNKINIFSKRVKKIKIDLLKKKNITIKSKFDYIFMFAGYVLNSNSSDVDKNLKLRKNYTIFSNCLNFSIKNSTKKIFWISSATGYPKVNKRKIFKENEFFNSQPSPAHIKIGLQTRRFEKIISKEVKKYKSSIVIIRPSEIFGENDNFDLVNSHDITILINKIFNNKKIEIENKFFIKKNYIYIGSLLKIILKIIKKNDEKRINIFNITDNKNFSLIDILKIVRKNFFIKPSIYKKKNIKKFNYFKSFSNKKVLKYLKLNKIDEFEFGLANTINWYKSNLKKKY